MQGWWFYSHDAQSAMAAPVQYERAGGVVVVVSQQRGPKNCNAAPSTGREGRHMCGLGRRLLVRVGMYERTKSGGRHVEGFRTTSVLIDGAVDGGQLWAAGGGVIASLLDFGGGLKIANSQLCGLKAAVPRTPLHRLFDASLDESACVNEDPRAKSIHTTTGS